MTPEQKLDRVMLWMSVGAGFVGLVTLSVAAPATYILVLACLAATGVLGTSLLMAGAMFQGCPIGWMFAGDMVKIGIEIAAAIVQAALSASAE